jgi:hypothetical protein
MTPNETARQIVTTTIIDPLKPWNAGEIMDLQKRALTVATAYLALEGALTDATAHLAGVASAYRDHGARHRSIGRATADPFFKTRMTDLNKAVRRARTTIRRMMKS